MNHQRNKYGYSYDHQHRLTAAYYQLPGSVVPDEGSFNTSYSYDENGNISILERFEGNNNPSNAPVEIDHLEHQTLQREDFQVSKCALTMKITKPWTK